MFLLVSGKKKIAKLSLICSVWLSVSMISRLTTKAMSMCDVTTCTSDKRDEEQILCVTCRRWFHKNCLPGEVGDQPLGTYFKCTTSLSARNQSWRTRMLSLCELCVKKDDLKLAFFKGACSLIALHVYGLRCGQCQTLQRSVMIFFEVSAFAVFLRWRVF